MNSIRAKKKMKINKSYIEKIPTPMRRMALLVIAVLITSSYTLLHAQEDKATAPRWAVPVVIENGDTIPSIRLRPLYVFAPLTFRSERERLEYLRLVRDVKVVLPFANLVSRTLIETYKYIETLPTEKERNAHLHRMEKELFKQYKPQLKKLTFRQGMLLMKLIDRQCNSTSYDLIDAFLGGFSAYFWNTFAGLFGASLKVKYEPQGKDWMTERVVIMVQNGLL